MSSPITIDKTKRTTPCHPDCRHPTCVGFRKVGPLTEQEKAWVERFEKAEVRVVGKPPTPRAPMELPGPGV